MNVRSAVSSRLALQRFFTPTDLVPSKTSISRRSRPGSAAPFKDSRPDTLAFMLSTLSINWTRSSIAIQIQSPSTPTYPVYVWTGAAPTPCPDCNLACKACVLGGLPAFLQHRTLIDKWTTWRLFGQVVLRPFLFTYRGALRSSA